MDTYFTHLRRLGFTINPEMIDTLKHGSVISERFNQLVEAYSLDRCKATDDQLTGKNPNAVAECDARWTAVFPSYEEEACECGCGGYGGCYEDGWNPMDE